ncbi:hypothetical protein [Dyadobacter sp. LHD-138]|uniref:hypothetical protein n=1 Tax=Dyadobacter sp. LHD-138 TaxID=3071413 RepID=UPI0027E18177|nr:hypothetical protein [Dyadobacter sp. LHD-138]MDQ6477463.1 hypothetical protein [Dyadobacter sp. LHD-138]
MQTTFVVEPEEWTEKFWRKIMPLFRKRKIRVTVEEIETGSANCQIDTYFKINKLQKEFSSFNVFSSTELSKTADESYDKNF